MKVQYREEIANHSGPESCAAHREVCSEALTGETNRPAIEPRNQEIRMQTELTITECNTVHGATREPCTDPARSETLCMLGSDLHASWEISSVPGAKLAPGGTGKVNNSNPVAHADEKSDTSVVPKKPPNNGRAAEVASGRDVAKGNAGQTPARRTQSRISASMGLEGIRKVARQSKKVQFTALLHHITPELLEQSFNALRRDAAVGVDGVWWPDYEEGLHERVSTLHRKIHTGSYRANPSRRVYIPKADGKQRPLGIACLEDKVVQQAGSQAC